ncbi:hypothetical protein [Paracholeplasma manati]|uniref:hypothetical protein n=1 Tax=Paracholeplasma manati TaxID=591373 RepID=UPI00240815C1|nr:hypothetical protein [Paracholeplasma manati]MDG0889172.1 hypothetical protein [Paracholeplasma manati]
MNIQHASLVLGSVGITNVFLNPVFLQPTEGVKAAFIHDMYNDLKQNNDELMHWYSGLFNDQAGYQSFRDTFNAFSRSHSSYEVISKKEILLTCQLEDVKLSDLIKSFPAEDKKLVKSIKDFQYLCYSDSQVFVFENGNCVLLSTIYINNDHYDDLTYQQVVTLLHRYYQQAYRPTLIKLIEQLQTAYKKYAYKYEKSFAENYITSQVVNQISMDKSFQFAIYNHFFLLSEQAKCDCLNQLFLGSEDLSNISYIETHDSKISLGYTHATFVTNNTNGVTNDFIDKYKIPLLMVLANWAAIKALSINIDQIGKIYRYRGENKYNFIGLKNERNAINLFLLALKSISSSLEGYNASNHPIYSNIIEKYRATFQEERSLKRLNQQIEILSSLSSEIDRQRTARAEFILNFSLILLTGLSIFSTVELFYKINLDYTSAIKQGIFTISLIAASILVLVNVLFHKFKI